MAWKKTWILTLCGLLLGMLAGAAAAEDKTIKMSTTTSTRDSGLLDILLPEFKKDTGIEVQYVAKGTGAAIMDGQDGNVDVIFVHSPPQEEAFIKAGWGTKRYAVMHNDFVLLGPPADPAGIKGMKDAAGALKKIAEKKAAFISRGDKSGTHAKEIELWKATGLPMETTKSALVKGG
ncbi:MAG: extracellular solute-binding protein, partial [Proteobacteria bacterium]|nr:extracellular solute-binding protein [Pseudomonadota bacterium]